MRKSEPLNPADYKNGLLCSVLRHADGVDCSNHGITSRVTDVVLFGPEVDGPFTPEDVQKGGMATLYLHSWTEKDGSVSLYASPDPENGMKYMFGGNFIFTSDSRFPSSGAIKVHDRREW